MSEQWTIGMLIGIAEREVSQRLQVYPRLVRDHKMSRRSADLQIEGMREIVTILKGLQDPATAWGALNQIIALTDRCDLQLAVQINNIARKAANG